MMAAIRIADRPEDALMQGVAKALDTKLVGVGHAAVREIVTTANRLSVDPNDLPYVFWALATKAGLPRIGKKELAALDLMVTIMVRSGTMPNYQSAFNVTTSIATDSAVDVLAPHMATWAQRVMYPTLLQAYRDALTTQVKAVPAATNGKVPKDKAFDFLRLAFRQVLDLSSRKFRDGELLRRVVRILPI